MNPYQQIDNARKNPGNFSVPGPAVDLPQHMRGVWADFYYGATKAVIGLVSTNQKPAPNTIYTFNVLSSGNQPFVNDAMRNFVTECGMIYCGALKEHNQNGHNQSLAREVIGKMLNMYQWAIICNDKNLRNMVANNSDLVRRAKDGLQSYKDFLEKAQNVLNGGWGNDGWGNSGGSNNAWNDSNDNGWGGDSWSGNAGNDLMNISNSWEDDSSGNSGWGSSAATIEQSDWGLGDDIWGTHEDSSVTVKKENKMDGNLSEIELAIRNELAKVSGQVAEPQQPAVEQQPSTHPVSEGATNVGDSTFNDLLDGVTFEEWPDQETTDPSTVYQAAVAIEDAAVLGTENQELRLVIDLVPNKGTENELHGFDGSHEDEEQYVNDIMNHFGGLPDEAMRISVNGYDHVILSEAIVMQAPFFLSNFQRRQVCKSLPNSKHLGAIPWYIINKNMELQEVMISLDGHDIYEYLDEKEIGAIINLHNTAKTDEIGEEVTSVLGEVTECDEILHCNNRSEVEIDMRRHLVQANKEVVDGKEFNSIRAIVNFPIAKMQNMGELTAGDLELTLPHLIGIYHTVREKSARTASILERNCMRVISRALEGSFGTNLGIDSMERLSEIVMSTKEDNLLEELSNQELIGYINTLLGSMKFKEVDDSDNMVMYIEQITVLTENLMSLEELVGFNTTSRRMRVPLFDMEEYAGKDDFKAKAPIRIILANGMGVTFYGVSDQWAYLIADEQC